jgi:hypothetical protein
LKTLVTAADGPLGPHQAIASQSQQQEYYSE